MPQVPSRKIRISHEKPRQQKEILHSAQRLPPISFHQGFRVIRPQPATQQRLQPSQVQPRPTQKPERQQRRRPTAQSLKQPIRIRQRSDNQPLELKSQEIQRPPGGKEQTRQEILRIRFNCLPVYHRLLPRIPLLHRTQKESAILQPTHQSAWKGEEQYGLHQLLHL